MCEWKPDFDRLDERVDKIETRLSTIESASSMTRESLAAVNGNIETLSQQMANMDARLVEEKQKWGEILRNCVKWVVRGLVTVAVYAAGVNISKELFFRVIN